MNSSYTRYHRPPSVLPSEAVGGIGLLVCFVLCVLALPASAQNLLVNGDFEAGTVAPWTGGELRPDPSGGLLARVGDSQVGAILSQTVTTVPGQRYMLSVELRNEDQSCLLYTSPS